MKLTEMGMDERIVALARKQLAQEQMKARRRAHLAALRLKQAQQEEVALDETAKHLGVEHNLFYDRDQIEKAKEKIVRAEEMTSRAEQSARSKALALEELKSRFRAWYPYEQLPVEATKYEG